MHMNVEFKARCLDLESARTILLAQPGVHYRGEDHQIDTYYHAPNGRLKSRRGSIENSLIGYTRENRAGVKQSDVHLSELSPQDLLNVHGALAATLGIRVVVDKRREIYFIDNVKFHLDRVDRLGTFIEVEAIDAHGTIGKARLQEQCDRYRELLGVSNTDMIDCSYSDLLERAASTGA